MFRAPNAGRFIRAHVTALHNAATPASVAFFGVTNQSTFNVPYAVLSLTEQAVSIPINYANVPNEALLFSAKTVTAQLHLFASEEVFTINEQSIFTLSGSDLPYESLSLISNSIQYKPISYVIANELLVFNENNVSSVYKTSIPNNSLSINENNPSYKNEVRCNHSLSYGTTALSLHRSLYEGTSEVVSAHESLYGITSQSLSDVTYQSSLGTSLVFTIHESAWASTLLSAVQTLHEAIYATLGSSTVIGLHESSWNSVGGRAAVLAIHEAGWVSTGSSSTLHLHEVSWSSGIRVPTTALHEVLWNSAGTTPIFALHESVWNSAGGLNSVFTLHDSLWNSAGGLSAVFTLHESSWTYTPSAFQVNQSLWKSIISDRSIHEVGYETIDTTLVMSMNEIRYRSNQLAPIITAGLIYART